METNYIFLELDTTAPLVNLNIPYKSIRNNVIEVTIIANEKLSDYQDILLIDSEGGKHPLIFNKMSDNSFVGFIDLRQLPLGLATIYVVVSDEVSNLSNLITGSILIVNTNENDKISAYVNCTEVNQNNYYVENNTVYMYIESIKNIDFKEHIINCSYIENEVNVGVEVDGTNR